MRARLEQPVTPAESEEEEEEEEEEVQEAGLLLEDFTDSRYASRHSLTPQESGPAPDWLARLSQFCQLPVCIDPRGAFYRGEHQPELFIFSCAATL